MNSTDILIIGGGLVGCATAHYLARTGASVTLAERFDLNTRASGANAGSIHLQIPYPEFTGKGRAWAETFAPVLPMMMRSIELWKTLDEDLGETVGFAQTGGVIAARTAGQMQAIARKAELERRHGVETQMLDGPALRRLAPYLSATTIGGAWCPPEGKADPLVATLALARAARRHGARILTDTAVLGLERDRAGFRVQLAREALRAGQVINAAGADAGRIAAMLGVDVPVEGFPLQVSVTEPAAPLVRHLVYSAAGKLTLKQMSNGSCVIGGGWPSHSRQDGRLSVDDAALAANLALAAETVPALAAARVVRTWTATVNGTADWRPLIGEVPGVKGFYLALFPWMGFTAGPVTARLTADLVLGRRPEFDLRPLDLRCR